MGEEQPHETAHPARPGCFLPPAGDQPDLRTIDCPGDSSAVTSLLDRVFGSEQRGGSYDCILGMRPKRGTLFVSRDISIQFIRTVFRLVSVRLVVLCPASCTTHSLQEQLANQAFSGSRCAATRTVNSRFSIAFPAEDDDFERRLRQSCNSASTIALKTADDYSIPCTKRTHFACYWSRCQSFLQDCIGYSVHFDVRSISPWPRADSLEQTLLWH